MEVVKTPRAIIEVLGAVDENGHYPVTGYEIERHYTFSGEGSQFAAPRVNRDEATIDEVNELRGASEETLTSQFAAANAQIATLLTENKTLHETIIGLSAKLQRVVDALAQ